jgi:hypothetical protein
MTVELGRFGIWRRASTLTPELAAEVEALGYGAIWIGGSPGDRQLAQDARCDQPDRGRHRHRQYLGGARRGGRSVLPPDCGAAPEPVPARCRYRPSRSYTNNLLRLGSTEQDIASGGSDRLIDALVAHGNADAVAARLVEHLDAGLRRSPIGARRSVAVLLQIYVVAAGPSDRRRCTAGSWLAADTTEDAMLDRVQRFDLWPVGPPLSAEGEAGFQQFEAGEHAFDLGPGPEPPAAERAV